LDASTKATGTTHKRARERAEYGPPNAQIESHAHLIGDFFNTIGQLRRNEAIIDESGLPPIAAELTRRSDLAAGDIVVE
jgi:hypothetical protein